MNKELLYGDSSENSFKRVVSTEVLQGKDNICQVFYRHEDDTVTSEYHTFKPYTYIRHDDPLVDKFYEDTETIRLLGTNPLNLMVYSDTFAQIRWIEKNVGEYFTPFRQSQWMLQSRQTQFKGMDFDDPLRLYFDLEVLTAEGFDFPNSTRQEDKIILIAIWTNRGDEIVLALNDDSKTPEMENVYRCASEKILIEKFIKVIRKLDPDIIANHNIFGFDFPYLRDRAQMHQVKLQIGRDGSEPYSFQTSIKFAEKSDDYENFSIYGRCVIDTYFLAKQFDQVYRGLESLSLKNCAKFLGRASDDRTYIEGKDIAPTWRGEHDKWTRKDLISYAIDDVKEAQVLDQEWGNGIFEQTKMVPLPMQDVARYGTGNKFELLFEREYYRYLWSIPTADPKESYSGGYAQPSMYGYINKPVVYADISSMYPSIKDLLGIRPPKDELLIFDEICELLKQNRYKAKYGAQQTDDPVEKRRLKAVDGQMKIFLNTGTYGWLGSRWAKWNYYEGAMAITEAGQKIIKEFNKQTEVLGGQVVRTDTDGSLIIVPKQYQKNEDTETEFIKIVEKKVNELIEQGDLL